MTRMLRLVGALFLLSAVIARCQQPIPIIFDTDIGSDIDDALALALALQSPELDVRAVTTVTDDTVGRSRLAWKELGLYGRHDIPLATGASETLVGPALTERVPPQFQVLTAQDILPLAARRRVRPLRLHKLWRHDLAGYELRGALALDVYLKHHWAGTRVRAGRIPYTVSSII